MALDALIKFLRTLTFKKMQSFGEFVLLVLNYISKTSRAESIIFSKIVIVINGSARVRDKFSLRTIRRPFF